VVIATYISPEMLDQKAMGRFMYAIWCWLYKQANLLNEFYTNLNKFGAVLKNNTHEFLSNVFKCYGVEHKKRANTVKKKKHNLFNYHYLLCMIYSGCV